MLFLPHVSEDKAAHVRESWNARFVVQSVIGPEESAEVLHQVELAGVVAGN